ncbi:hypothetical protein ANN_17763 [Periplaneta americana]|uniref:Uncharacterized protein n=1 Tax=Periplaneta americana TaxID=6978 RepID=A0ABQ8SUF8_PERAM|nr:hypothetical protein ANN_17763 [Periplaneta americana]
MSKEKWTIIQPEWRYRVVSMMIPPAIIAGFRNWISLPIVAPQVHHDVGWAPVPYIGRSFFPHEDSNQRTFRNMNSSKHTGEIRSALTTQETSSSFGEEVSESTELILESPDCHTTAIEALNLFQEIRGINIRERTVQRQLQEAIFSPEDMQQIQNSTG